jgi:hypothetical protein
VLAVAATAQAAPLLALALHCSLGCICICDLMSFKHLISSLRDSDKHNMSRQGVLLGVGTLKNRLP